MQVKLLRALEENRLRPVGSDEEVEFDVRVLAATHRDLESDVEDGRFRQDLFYRINVIQLHLPPLRSRGSDILRLAARYIEVFAERSKKEVSGIAEPAAEKLLSYSWPGNVRELRNVMERAVALTPYDMVTLGDLPDKIRHFQATPSSSAVRIQPSWFRSRKSSDDTSSMCSRRSTRTAPRPPRSSASIARRFIEN